MMNRSSSERSEEARRQAAAAQHAAKRKQDAMLAERAKMFDLEAQKVRELRAKRIARVPAVSAKSA